MPNIITVTMPAGPQVIEIQVPGVQGPSAFSVGPINTLTPGTPGLWVETKGEDVYFWLEDGL